MSGAVARRRRATLLAARLERDAVIAASLSEPHTDAVAGDLVGIYMRVCVCRTSSRKFPFSRARWPHSVT